ATVPKRVGGMRKDAGRRERGEGRLATRNRGPETETGDRLGLPPLVSRFRVAQLFFRRLAAAMPAKPVASRVMVAGSGTVLPITSRPIFVVTALLKSSKPSAAITKPSLVITLLV